MRYQSRKLKEALAEVGAKKEGDLRKVSVRIERKEPKRAVSRVDALNERQVNYLKARLPGIFISTSKNFNVSIIAY